MIKVGLVFCKASPYEQLLSMCAYARADIYDSENRKGEGELMSVIEAKEVSVFFESKKYTVTALDRFSAVFGEGINVIVGPSGCGKTTLLRTIAGLTYCDDGQVLLDGYDITDMQIKDRNFAYVSQEYVLYPQYTVFDNIAFPLRQIGAGKEEIIRRVKEIAELTGLTVCLTRKPKHISGGQQQRVAIARALVKQPAVCLMDEPFSNVDEQTHFKTLGWIKDTFHTVGCTAIYVTHDIKEALALADTLYVMNEGRLELFGPPETVFESQDPAVRALMDGGLLKL